MGGREGGKAGWTGVAKRDGGRQKAEVKGVDCDEADCGEEDGTARRKDAEEEREARVEGARCAGRRVQSARGQGRV